MENPDTWGFAERVVDEAIQQAEQMQSEGLLGLSLARQITDALRENGLLIEL